MRCPQGRHKDTMAILKFENAAAQQAEGFFFPLWILSSAETVWGVSHFGS